MLSNEPPGTGLEAEFIHLKVIARAQTPVGVEGRLSGEPVSGVLPLGAVLPRFEMSHGLNLCLANVVLRRPIAARAHGIARLAVAARGGAGLTIPHAEVTFQGRDEDGYRLGRPAWQASVGIEFRVWRNLHLVSEAKWTHTRQRLDAAGVHIDGAFRTRHVVAGISYSLAPSARHRPFVRDTAF